MADPGDLVCIALGRNEAEADFIANLLRAEGVPSLLRRTRGFDVPDMLAAGPRDVLVPQAAEATARQILLQTGLQGEHRVAHVPALRIAAGLLAGASIAALIVWAGAALS